MLLYGIQCTKPCIHSATMLHMFRTRMVARHLVSPVPSQHAYHLHRQVEKKHMPPLQAPDATSKSTQRTSKAHAPFCLLLVASKTTERTCKQKIRCISTSLSCAETK